VGRVSEKRREEVISGSKKILRGKPVISGYASGKLVVSREPLSFWGGYDSDTGEIIDRHHHLSGEVVKGCILAVPGTKGSSTTTAVLLEALQKGNAPLAIITSDVDSFLALALVVSEEMYSTSIPLVALGSEVFAELPSEGEVTLKPDGRIIVYPF
jgi:predicted aconitase with swiveling domain